MTAQRDSRRSIPAARLRSPLFRSSVISRLGCLALAGLLLAQAGCEKPEPKYQVEIDEDVVSFKPSDFGVPAEAIPKNGSRLLDEERSEGRFPTGLGVIRLYAAMDEARGERYLRVSKMEPAQGVYWNQLLVDLPPIREVKILGSWNFDPRGIQWDRVLAQSSGVDCNLCMMYAAVDDTDADAELIGALWEVASRQVIATYRVAVKMPEDEEDDDDVEDEEQRHGPRYHHTGKWKCEADYRADTELRTLVRNTLWDLIGQDEKPTTTQPSPWRGDLPLYPRDYDSYRTRSRSDKRTP